MSANNNSVRTAGKHLVDMPAGGQIEVEDADEQVWFEELADKYKSDYAITKTNDLVLLGALLAQSLVMRRAQQDLIDPKKATAAISTVTKTAEQIREIEKALGIDKKTREAGGQHTVVDYLTRLKQAAHTMGIRISDRVLEHEDFANELRWRIRLLRNGDDEDRRHHGITKDSVLKFAEDRLADIEQREKTWAKEKGAIFVGQL